MTRDDLIEAALADGLATFTLSGVARRVGLSHAALYRHVDTHHDLLIAALTEVAGRTPWPAPTGGWHEQLRAFAHCLLAACEAHPGLAQALSTVPEAGRAAAGPLTRAREGLQAAGLPPATAALALDLAAGAVLMTHLHVFPLAGRSPSTAQRLDAQLDVILRGLPGHAARDDL